MDYAGLTPGNPLLIVGLEHYIEVWNPERWEEYNAQLDSIRTDPALWENLKI